MKADGEHSLRIEFGSDRLWKKCDLCIIGAGPVGLTVASELIGSGLSVVLLESGKSESHATTQRLNDAETPSAYGPLQSTRHRQIGGTVNLWNTQVGGLSGAKYVPLDAIDFAARAGRGGAWPFERNVLDPYYERAHRLAELGPFDYSADRWRSNERQGFSLNSDLLENGVYQFGTSRPFLRTLPERLAAADNVQVVTDATVVELETSASGSRVATARIAAAGSSLRIAATRFVLAAGTIESCRLMLASNRHHSSGLGNSSGLVGRYFMEHPRDYAMSLVPTQPLRQSDASFYDIHQSASSTWVMGRIALKGAALIEADLPNASVTLLADTRPTRRTWQWMRRLFRMGSHYPRGGAGWTQSAETPERFRLLINLEQAPRAENRIALTGHRDALGMRQARLFWSWHAEEQARLVRLRALIRQELEGAGLGRITVDDQAMPDPRAHHHAGTLRMHDDAQLGVTDRNGRVHDVENLYCAGAAVFPTAGFANPMLTILAMALRLAEHLKSGTPNSA